MDNVQVRHFQFCSIINEIKILKQAFVCKIKLLSLKPNGCHSFLDSPLITGAAAPPALQPVRHVKGNCVAH